MGLNLNWIAVQGRDSQSLLDRFGFEEVGEASDETGADFTCASLPGEWVVLVAAREGSVFDESLVAASSHDGFAIGCQVLESVTFSEVRAYCNGHLAWSVVHDPDENPNAVRIEGEPPPQFAEIKRGLDAARAAQRDEAVDFLFEAPLELAAGICGYRAGQSSGLKWAILQKKSPNSGRSIRRPRSLSAAMRSELLPLLQSLGFEPANEKPALAEPDEIVRFIDGLKQTIWFDFATGAETYIIVHFRSVDAAGSGFEVCGHVTAPRTYLPPWKRFTWKRFRALAASQPTPEDVIGATVGRARDEIVIADSFLKRGEPNPCIYVDRTLSKGRWPSPG